MDWTWTQPINAWELILSSAFGLFTTIVSVVIGVRYALRQQRDGQEAAMFAADREAAQVVVSRLQSDYSYIGIEMTWASGGLPEKSIISQWRPENLRKVIAKHQPHLPSSHRAIADWMTELSDELIANGNISFRSSDNATIRAEINGHMKQVEDRLTAFRNGEITIAWFLAKMTDSRRTPKFFTRWFTSGTER